MKELAYGQETAQVVLEQVRLEPDSHDQTIYESSCGTQRCVAGWARYFHEGHIGYDVRGTAYWGMKYLGLNFYDANMLFFGVDNEEAVHALEYLAKGDAIDWAAVLGGEYWVRKRELTMRMNERALHAVLIQQ